jgi:hypothetical protein
MKNLVLSFLLISLSTTMLFGQLKKGDMLIDFSSYYTKEKNRFYQGGNWTNFTSVSPSIGYMFTDKIMLGIDLSFYKIKGSVNSSVFSKNLDIAPFCQYYFLDKNNFRPYLFLQTSFNHSKANTYNILYGPENYNEFAFSAESGFGMNYFLSSNIALKASIGTSIFYNKNNAILEDLIDLDIGLQIFFKNEKNSSADLLEDYLKKGNYILSGSGHFIIDNNRYYGTENILSLGAKETSQDYGLTPQLSYFISDIAAISGGINFNGFSNGNSSRLHLGLMTGVDRYFAIDKRAFFVPSLTLFAGSIYIKQYETAFVPNPASGLLVFDTIQNKTSNYYLRGRFGLAFKYFTKGSSILSIGADHSWSIIHFDFKDDLLSNYSSKNAWWDFYGDYEYFFSKNLSALFRATFSLNRFRYGTDGIYLLDNNGGFRSVDFSLRLNYFFFKNRNKVGLKN